MHKPSSNLSNRRRRRQESGDLADDGGWGHGEVTAEWRSVLENDTMYPLVNVYITMENHHF